MNNEKVKTNRLNKKNITQDDIDYCFRDCEITYEALFRMFEVVGGIKLTISSCAMYSFRSSYLPENLIFSEMVDEFYNSYYGGRTEVFKLGSVNCNVYDINSLYPYAMFNCIFPDIKNLKKEGNINIDRFIYLIKRYEGLAKIKIYHKETYFGFIPFRSDKLLFPVGTFTTTVNFNEIRFALENNVIEIISIEYAIYGNPTPSPFKNFVLDNYTKRKNSTNELDKLIYKLKLNSLYGRFAMRQKFNTTYYELIPFEIINELQKTEKFYKLHLFNQEQNDCFLTTENEKFKSSFYSIPVYSSYITSHARIILLKNLLKNENNSVCYCDTDSIFLEKKFIGDVGKELGQFKREEKKVFFIKGLKNYKYIETVFYLDLKRKINKFAKSNIPTVKMTLKGINKNSEKIDENTYRVIQYYKTKESLRQNKETGSRKEVIKVLQHEYDKRIILNNGETKPIKYEENT